MCVFYFPGQDCLASTMVGSNRNRRQRTQTKRYTDDNPSTFTTKGENHEVRREKVSSPAKKRLRPREQPRRKDHKQTSLEPSYTSLSHHVSISHLFSNNERKNSVVHGRGLGAPPSLKAPAWEQIPLAHCFFPEDIDKETGKSVPGSRKISRSCTCLSLDNSSTYLAIGDTAGFVSIYMTDPKILCVSLLSTSASMREHASELKLPPSRKYGLYEKKTHLNKILQISFSGKKIAVSTTQEIELVDVEQNQILWSLPTSTTVQSLCIHPTTSQLLCSFASDTKINFASPLWSICHNTDDVIAESAKRTFVQPTIDNKKLSLGHRCMAIWDKSIKNQIIMVTLVNQTDGDTCQDLLRLENTSFKVLQRTTIPNKPAGKSSCNTVEYLSQSPSGHLTLVSSSRGIRLLESSSFQLLQVFGENVALHGHSLLFQQCCFVTKSSLPNEVECLLEARENEKIYKDSDWVMNQCCWVLGVPHARREPQEMKETLHMWDFHDGKRTSYTILAPPKSNGFGSVIFARGKLIITTLTGDCYMMSPKVLSDFSGIMYPPGYQVIGENLEYIEDEDELDNFVKMPEKTSQVRDGEGASLDDMEMEVAMRLSMEEQKSKSETEEIDVGSLDSKEEDSLFITCRPDLSLKQSCQSGISSAATDSTEYNHSSFTTSVLLPMPHVADALTIQKSQTGSDELKCSLGKQVKGKRSKAASLEAMLKASLNLDLRKIMIARQQWGMGAGSKLIQDRDISFEVQRTEGKNSIHSKDEKNEVCSKDTEDDNANFLKVACVPTVSSHEKSFRHDSLNERIELGVGPESSYDYPGTITNTGEAEQQVKMDAAAALLMAASGVNDISIRQSVQNPKNKIQTINQESQNPKPDATSEPVCSACKGRWVFHTCGKKSKPVDYDELLKAEEEKREKEEEKKKKVRAEKRRIADAKRREARKKKKLEQEERLRQQEMERIRQEKEDREKQIERNRLHSEDKERRRAEMLQRLQAEQVAPALSSIVDWPPVSQSYSKAKNDCTQSYSSSFGNQSQNRDQLKECSEETQPHSSAFSEDWPPLASPRDVRRKEVENEPKLSDADYGDKEGYEKQPILDKRVTSVASTDAMFSYAGNKPSVTESNGLRENYFDSSDAKCLSTSETLDPAQALASLASFASAAAPATIGEQANNTV